MTFYEAVLDGRSIGVPGTPALLGLLHAKFGSKELDTLIAPAYDMAINGFKPSKGLEIAIRSDIGKLDNHVGTRDYFYGQENLFKNKDYGYVLKKFAKDGYKVFYEDPISTNIIDAANQENGILSQRDFSNYRVIIREPVCDYFMEYRICSMGEPSSGALTMLQILKMIEHNPTWHNYIEASKLAFADRNYFIADPDYTVTPSTTACIRSRPIPVSTHFFGKSFKEPFESLSYCVKTRFHISMYLSPGSPLDGIDPVRLSPKS